MMENIDQFWEDDDGERMRKASNAYDDSILTLADAIRFALVTPDEYDVSLRARTERVNAWCRQLGKRNVCLVSIHTNAAGNGKQWMNVRGWTCCRRLVTSLPIACTRPLRSGSPATSSGKTTPMEIPTGKATSTS